MLYPNNFYFEIKVVNFAGFTSLGNKLLNNTACFRLLIFKQYLSADKPAKLSFIATYSAMAKY